MLLTILTNPIFLIFLSIFLGTILGKVKIGRFKFGDSGVLIIALVISWMVLRILINNGYNERYVLVPKSFFLFSLVLFISSIGLIAGGKIAAVMKEYGFKFLVMAFIITFSGYFATKLLTSLFNIKDKFITMGIFTGALTSSPGLAAALESVKNYGASQIGLGYAIAYVPGVLVVIFSMYLLPIIFKIDLQEEKRKLKSYDDEQQKTSKFNFLAYSIVVIVGLLIGDLKIRISSTLFSFGLTGGVLISSLFFAYIGKIGRLSFRMENNSLNLLKQFGLLLFLSSVGLKYGYESISLINVDSLLYLVVSFTAGFIAILMGFLVGRYLFKINWIILSGAICGGMTSTPGLGSAIDSTDSNDPTHGYGATYPFALIFMVLLVSIT